MKILLTGGSGTVGRKVLQELCKNADHDITAFDVENRHTRKFYRPYRNSVTVRYGDLSNREDVLPLCAGVDVVIHLAAIIPPLADEAPDLAHKVNVVGTGNLIDSLEARAKDAFFIYASSVSVYGDRIENPLIRVGDALRPSEGDEYAKTKILAEQLIQESKLDWCILRLSAIMGVDNHKLSGLIFHMPLATPMEITTPEDTGLAFANAIAKRELLSKLIWNLGGGEQCRVSYREFLTRSFSIFGLGPLDFPEQAFAQKNFHCGFYQDGGALNDILAFRRSTMDTYFAQLERSVSPFRRFAASLAQRLVKAYLLKLSEPYKATKENNRKLLDRYFN